MKSSRKSSLSQGSAAYRKAMLRTLDRAAQFWDIPILGAERTAALTRLISEHRSRNALEIGSLLGYSAIAIAEALGPKGRLICVEANPYLAKFVTNNVARAGLSKRVQVVIQDARKPIPDIQGHLDFVFIDAAKEQYLEYLKGVEICLAAGAVVVADNVKKFRSDVTAYLDYVRKPGGNYESHTQDFEDDAMEISIFRPGHDLQSY
jgi:predicted O-methyltransferase YrrM